MAITAYTGVPGTGKSYALVSEVIVPGVRDGRRVLTNVAGVNPDAVRDYCAEKWPKCADQLGEVILFEGHQTLEPNFFPARHDLTRETFVQAGDLVVFDEVRMYWPRRGKFAPEIMQFLRYHRHFVSEETHASTDVVLASQLITDFHEDYKGCIERSYKFKKLKAVGLSTRYVYQVWEGSEQRKGQQVSNGGGKYRKEIFPLYQSYAGGPGEEKSTDRRQNVLRQPKFLVLLGVTVSGVIGCGYAMLSFFDVGEGEGVSPAAAATPAKPVPPSAVGAAAIPAVNGAPPVSDAWRISGVIQSPGLNVVVLVDRAGNSRFEDPSNFSFVDGRPFVGVIDGERVFAIGMQPATGSGSTRILGAK